jgi:hypothetical protein
LTQAEALDELVHYSADVAKLVEAATKLLRE